MTLLDSRRFAIRIMKQIEEDNTIDIPYEDVTPRRKPERVPVDDEQPEPPCPTEPTR
jgi:hypothetical protein